jgi:4-amino-4-deoxy-L-arabinose transferase-like glycosyltransferase
MTSLLDALLALLVCAILNLVVLHQIRSRLPLGDARFLSTVYTWSLLLRSALAVILNVFATDSIFALTFWGDSTAYDIAGYQLAQQWSGEPVVGTAPLAMAVSGYGWVHFVAAVYFLFGRNHLLVQFLNGMLGGLTILVIYAIASRLFDAKVARLAALFMGFFPQVVFWSAGMYKDPATLLCIALCMYSVVRLRERLSAGMILVFVLAELSLIGLRFYIAYFVAFATLATFLFTGGRNPIRLVITYALLLAALVGALNVAVARETLERQASFLSLERLQITRDDQATSSRSGFGTEFNVSTPAGALAALPTGIIYLLFAPFPWAISGLRQVMVLPETLVWYALMPAFVRGALYAIRHKFGAVLPIVVFAVSLTGAYALMQGNVGTAYRQRTQITMFFYIFMAVGIVQKRRQKDALTAVRPRAARLAEP